MDANIIFFLESAKTPRGSSSANGAGLNSYELIDYNMSITAGFARVYGQIARNELGCVCVGCTNYSSRAVNNRLARSAS